MPTRTAGLASGLALGLLTALCAPALQAQPPGFGGRGGAPAALSPRESAPVDLTGTWVALVTEDWIERMSPDSPASGTGGGFGFGGRGGGGPGQPTPRSDDACAAYAAGGIMRVPGRVRIRWQDENTLQLEFDAGSQRRLVRFGAPAESSSATASLQGQSTASWQLSTSGGRGRGGPPQGAPTTRWGSLEIRTTGLTPGYLLTSRSWYGEGATLTELVRYHEDFGREYFTVTAIIEENGATTSMASSTFLKESNDSKFDPGGCEIVPR